MIAPFDMLLLPLYLVLTLLNTGDVTRSRTEIRRLMSCTKCSYSLDGLDPGSTCPECGTPQPVHLEIHVPRRYLTDPSRFVWCLKWCVPLCVMFVCAGWLERAVFALLLLPERSTLQAAYEAATQMGADAVGHAAVFGAACAPVALRMPSKTRNLAVGAMYAAGFLVDVAVGLLM